MRSTVPICLFIAAQYTNRPCLWVFDALTGSQCLIKRHERILCEVYCKVIVPRRPECIADERHVPAIKERRYQINCIIFDSRPRQPTKQWLYR